MLLYHVTIKIDKAIREEWQSWMLSKHIPDVMNTGLFIDFRFCQMQFDEPDGYTFSVQYTLDNESDLERYMNEFAPALQKDHKEKYEGKFVAYRSLHHILAFSSRG
jgi:hypothetical protein